MNKLPEWNGWTVDEYLKQFRKVTIIDNNPNIEFVDFDSINGEVMLNEYYEEIIR
jgi:hypothetical protein